MKLITILLLALLVADGQATRDEFPSRTFKPDEVLNGKNGEITISLIGFFVKCRTDRFELLAGYEELAYPKCVTCQPPIKVVTFKTFTGPCAGDTAVHVGSALNSLSALRIVKLTVVDTRGEDEWR